MLYGRRESSTRVRTLKAALDEFLRAPSREDGLTNSELIAAHLGSKGIHLVDPPSFDAVSLKYERPVKTFEEAFYACWRGHRDWLKFDIATLRDCDDLWGLELPARVEQAVMRAEEDEERAALQGEAAEREYQGLYFVEEEQHHPPAELRHRPGPAKRLRLRLSRSARGRGKLAAQYRAAKAAYHRAGRALRCSHEKC